MRALVLILIFLTGSIDGFSQEQSKKDSVAQYRLDSIHKPKVSLIASAILPGGGQIYNQIYKTTGQRNHLWWKLPIIYGGLGTTVYMTISNNFYYKTFKGERIARLDDSYVSTTYAALSDSQLKVYQDQYDRWRNLSIIGGLGIYLLQMIDANVEGHLMHFDTSDELSLSWRPTLISLANSSVAGFSFRISF